MTSITRRDVLIDALAGASVAGLLSGTANRRLRQRWVGSNDWETFPCTIREDREDLA